MLFIKCIRITERINPNVSKTTNERTTFLSKYAACNSKKSWFIKKQEATGFLSQLGIKIPLSKLPLLCDILF